MTDPIQKRPSNFRIEIPGDGEFKLKIQTQFQSVKNFIMKKMNKKRIDNGMVMEQLLEFWIQNQVNEEPEMPENHPFPILYNQTDREHVDEVAFMTARSSLSIFGEVFEAHTCICKGKLKISKSTMKGHVAAIRLQCEREKNHSYLWSSSPYLPNNEYLLNSRINHGLLTSGMLPIHYTRFCNAARIGFINKPRRKEFFKVYKEKTKEIYEESINDALNEEIGSYEDLSGINMMTDARHGWRKNSKDTSVVAIGENIHKVIECVHVTKADDKVSQRHEFLGTEKIYHHLNERNVDVNVHTHDRNLSINKYIRDSGFTTNQNDLWHAVKQIKKAVTNISKGPKIYEGVKWSQQLSDKVEPIAKHIHWAVRNCNQDPEKLRFHMNNILDHYRNIHSGCHESSRCRSDPNYEPSRELICSKKAQILLKTVLEKSSIYRYPQDYVLGKDTSYVESFNNVMNVFQDKRISFSDDQYRFRGQLAVCHWNENVDRAYTSVWTSKNPNAPKTQKGKKTYIECTYSYVFDIWNRFLDSLF